MANGSDDPGPKEYQTCDVLVLGAGLSGLNSAWELVQHRPSTRVCVLEAEDRVGGRTKDHHVTGCNNSVVELGAQWIAQESIDTDVWNLAVNELNLGVFNGWPWALYGFPYGPAHTDQSVKQRLDRVPPADTVDQASTFFGPDVSPSDPQANVTCQRRVAEVYNAVVLGQPWQTPRAEQLDQLTPLQWMAEMGCKITKEDVVAQGLNQVNISDPRTLPPAFYVAITSASSSGQEIFWRSSALWWLHSIKSNSGTISMAVRCPAARSSAPDASLAGGCPKVSDCGRATTDVDHTRPAASGGWCVHLAF